MFVKKNPYTINNARTPKIYRLFLIFFKIRQNAQREMKRFLQTTVHLELFVKVENNWRNKQKYLKEFGYNEDDY